jgi:putative membrane protein
MTAVLGILAVVLAGYLAAATAERRRRGWSTWSTSSFGLGSVLLGWALSPPFDAYADDSFGGHMAQHIVLGMVAPLALVLGSPVTLALRSLPHPAARRLGGLLRSRPLHVLTNPWLALLLSTGGLVGLYVTPLYEATTEHAWLHHLVHLHVVLAGCLFAWVIAGPDPAPNRPTVRTRLVVLGVSIATHASTAQLLYGGLLVDVHEPAVEMRAAGSLMYFGGDIAELLLAVALLVTWRPEPVSRIRRLHRA